MKTVHAVVLSALPVAFAIADDSTPRLHAVEAACIEYEMSGQMQNGTLRRCHRDYAYEQFEIHNFSVGFGGFTQTMRQHVITIGDTVYSIDLATNTGTKTINPMYDQLVSSMSGRDADEVGDAFIAAMGFTPTGATKTVAEFTCNLHESSMMGTVCLTDDLLMLEQSFMGNTMVATSVSVGEGGDDDDYALYQNVPISDGPDLSDMPNLQDLLNQAQQ